MYKSVIVICEKYDSHVVLYSWISPRLQKEMCGGCMTLICSKVQRSVIPLYIIEMWDDMRIDMEVYSIWTSSMCIHYSWHPHQLLIAKGAAQWLYDPYLQPSAEESNSAVYNIDVRWDEMRIEKALYSIYATDNNRLKTTYSIPCMNNSSIDCDPSSYAFLVAFTTEGKYIGHLPNIIKLKNVEN